MLPFTSSKAVNRKVENNGQKKTLQDMQGAKHTSL